MQGMAESSGASNFYRLFVMVSLYSRSSRISRKVLCSHTSRKTEIAKYAKRTTITKASFCAENAQVSRSHAPKILVILTTTDRTILNEEDEFRHNHRFAVVVQDLATQW